MRYNTYINNLKCLEWGLNANQGALFDLLNQVHSWASTTIIKDDVFYHISRNKVIQELPLFYSKPDTVYRHLKILEEKGLIIYKKDNKKDLVYLTNKGKCWNSEIDPNSEINPNKLGNQSENNSDSNPTYNVTKVNNNTNYNNVMNWWNSMPFNLTKIQKMSNKRISSLNLRVKEIGGDVNIFMQQVEKAISESNFLQGVNNTGWTCDFDFILQQSSFIKLMEGKYKNKIALSENEAILRSMNKEVM